MWALKTTTRLNLVRLFILTNNYCGGAMVQLYKEELYVYAKVYDNNNKKYHGIIMMLWMLPWYFVVVVVVIMNQPSIYLADCSC